MRMFAPGWFSVERERAFCGLEGAFRIFRRAGESHERVDIFGIVVKCLLEHPGGKRRLPAAAAALARACRTSGTVRGCTSIGVSCSDIDGEGARRQGNASGVGVQGTLQGGEIEPQGCLHRDPRRLAGVDSREHFGDAGSWKWRQARQVAELQHVHQEPRLEIDAFEIAALPVEDDAFVEQVASATALTAPSAGA